MPTAVPPSASTLPVGVGAVPHTVPREVIASPPSLKILPPSVAVDDVTAASDCRLEASSVGGPAEEGVVKDCSAELPVLDPLPAFVAQARK